MARTPENRIMAGSNCILQQSSADAGDIPDTDKRVIMTTG